jgi:hypothetical protein
VREGILDFEYFDFEYFGVDPEGRRWRQGRRKSGKVEAFG